MVVTARDVATRTGVSVSTVSRALTRPDLVSEDTRRRVQQAAKELNYQPNVSARSLSTGRHFHIGLVVPDLENPFFASVAKGVQSYARQLGYSVFIADTDENATLETELVLQLTPQVDGVLLCSPRSEPDQILALAQTAPLVLINRPVDSITSISLDNADGIRQAIRHLWALGHCRIAYAGGPRASWSTKIRLESFAAAIAQEPSMEAIDLGYFQPVHYGGMAAADLALASGATAIITFNDLMAIGLIQRLAARGVRVPQDVSVIGIDGIAQSSLISPPLTTVAGPLHQLGCAAVDALTNPAPVRAEKLLPVDLIVRNSTAEAPRGPEATRARESAGNSPVLVSGPN